MDSNTYFTVKDLAKITGLNESTLRTYLCHYSLVPYRVETKTRFIHAIVKTKESINAFISYIEIRSRKKLNPAVKKELRKEVE